MERLETGHNPREFYPHGATPPEVDGFAAVDANGKAILATAEAGVNVIGLCAQKSVDQIQVVSGVFALDNATQNPATRADRGKVAYLIDANTVNATGATVKVACGLITDVDDIGVWVDCSPCAIAAANALDIASNIS